MSIKSGLRRFNPLRLITLRSHLIVLVFVTMIPLFIFSAVMIYILAQRERATFQRGATERTLAVLTAVDTELKSSITTLEALATSRSLDTDNLPAFRDEVERVLKSQQDWFNINLAAASGQQVMNLLRAVDAQLPMTRERQSFEQVLRTGKPAIGHMVNGPVTGRQEFSVRVPVVRDGVTKYVLSAVVNPDTIARLILAQRLPPDWVGGVVDGNQRIVARTVAPERAVGQLASETLRAELSRSPDGWFRGTTLEGGPVYTPYNRSAFSGWTVAIGIPAAEFETPLRRTGLYVIIFGVIMLGAGITLAWTLSSHAAGAIDSLVGLVKNLGLSKDPAAARDVLPTEVFEIEHLKEVFLNASRLIQERSEERDKLEEALRHDVTQRTRTEQFLQLQVTVSRALTELEDLKSATPKIVQAVCELTGWEVGAIWDVDRSANELTCVAVWHVPNIDVSEFEAASRQVKFAPGVGLAGRVWGSGDPAWIPDVTTDNNFLRTSEAIKHELHAAVCFPIKLGADVLGVVECFSREIREVEYDCLQTLTSIGSQLGQFVERQRAALTLHEREARFVGLINSAMDAVIAVDGAQRVVLFNPAAEQMFRCAAAEAVGSTLDRFIPASFRAAHRKHIETFGKTGVTNRRMGALGALRGLRANGEEFPIEASISHMEVGGEKLFTVILRDITERKRAEEELRKLNEDLETLVARRTEALVQKHAELFESFTEREKLGEQLRQSQKMEAVGTLAGGVAHDFNNILNIIQGYASLLSEHDTGNKEMNESVTVIKDTVKRGSALVQRLLAVARKTGGAALESVHLNRLVEGMLPLIRETFPKTIDFSCSLAPDLPPIIADKNHIEQALLNLCVNARDAMPKGGTLGFKTQSLDGVTLQHLGEANGRYVCIEVSDAGVGIDESIRERIFEPFFTTKDQNQGTGLGLFVVYGIVKNHNGFVDVESKPMAGTSFRLYFPIAPVEVIAEEPTVETAGKTPAMSNGAGTVLVAEDEANMLHLLEKIFLRHGYKVLMATNGQTALDIYRQHKEEIDVVLLDMGLPKVSGRDVLLKIRSEKPDVKVIVTSGYIEPAIKSEIDHTRVKYLHKPYTPDDLFKILQSLAETPS